MYAHRLIAVTFRQNSILESCLKCSEESGNLRRLPQKSCAKSHKNQYEFWRSAIGHAGKDYEISSLMKLWVRRLGASYISTHLAIVDMRRWSSGLT